ncbi:MAG: phage tail sheath family protein [Arenimonas sp.]
MPVTVSYPGVYIDEVSSGVHTITSVSTSIAAFFGRTSKGKLNKAIRCLSPADFTRNFGAPHLQSDLGHAVSQFFANGGTDCYIVRVASGAAPASITLQSLLRPGPQAVLDVVAKSEGTWANQLRLEVSYATTNPHDTFNLKVIPLEGSSETYINLSMNPLSPRFAPAFVTQSSELIELRLNAAMGDPTLPGAFINTLANSAAGYSQARFPLGATDAAAAAALQAMRVANQDSFNISVNDAALVPVDFVGLPVLTAGIVVGELAGRINTRIAQSGQPHTVAVSLVDGGANVGRLLTITSNGGNQAAVRITRANSRDMSASLLMGVDQGGLEQTRYSNFRPAPNASFFHLHAGAVAPLDHRNLQAYVNGLAGLAQNAITSIAFDGQPVLTFNAGPNSLITTLPAGTDFWHQSALGNGDGVREKLGIIVNAINSQATLNFKAELWGYEIALISKTTSLNAVPSGLVVLPGGIVADRALNTNQYAAGTDGTSAFSSGGVAGNDGGAPTTADYFGSELNQTGFHALDPVDLFNLMIIPSDEGVTVADHQTLWGPASVYCASRRAFLLVDSPSTWTGSNGRPAITGDVSAAITGLNVSVKTHSAVFYPRLIFQNGPLKKSIGPSGAIAGLMARTDATRGVWKAPAGIEADVRGVLGVEVKLTDAENGVLNKKAVNCIRVFPNGLVNWGARTLAGDDDAGSEWKYIPIRRLALNIEESLFRGTKWVVFEPNDEPLWAKIRLNLNAYMMSLFRQGAFQGTSPKEAFYVKCDKETTTQDDRNKGIVNIEVGFAPLKPAEFVVIKIQQIAGDL